MIKSTEINGKCPLCGNRLIRRVILLEDSIIPFLKCAKCDFKHDLPSKPRNFDWKKWKFRK